MAYLEIMNSGNAKDKRFESFKVGGSIVERSAIVNENWMPPTQLSIQIYPLLLCKYREVLSA